MDRRMVGFIALLAYVAIYPIFNQYSWLDFLTHLLQFARVDVA